MRKLVADVEVGVELGTFLGASAEAMLESMPGFLYTVDTFEGSAGSVTAKLPEGRMLEYVRQRLHRFHDRVGILQGTSYEVSKMFNDESVDFVFIDAAHDYENVKRDILSWLPKIKGGGVMAGHDFDKESPVKITTEYIVENSHLEYDPKTGVHCGVVRAVSECFEQIVLENDPESTIWSARKEWAR